MPRDPDTRAPVASPGGSGLLERDFVLQEDRVGSAWRESSPSSQLNHSLSNSKNPRLEVTFSG
jgi:hypothetical protein